MSFSAGKSPETEVTPSSGWPLLIWICAMNCFPEDDLSSSAMVLRGLSMCGMTKST